MLSMAFLCYLGLGVGPTQTTLDVSKVVKTLYENCENPAASYDEYIAGFKGYLPGSEKSFSFQKEFLCRYIFNSEIFLEGSIFIGVHPVKLIFDGENYSFRTLVEMYTLRSRFIMGIQIKFGKNFDKGSIYATGGISDLKFDVIHNGKKENSIHYATPFLGCGLEVNASHRTLFYMEFQQKISSSKEIKLPQNVIGKSGKADIGIITWRLLMGIRLRIGGKE